MLILMISCVAVSADALQLAAPVDAHVPFEKYGSYKHDSTGAWSAHNLDAAQLFRTITAGSTRNFMSAGACVMYPGVRGNSALNLTEVVLNVCLLRNRPLNVDSLSIIVDGVRYDFLGAAKRESIGSYACERFELPMDAEGMRMLAAMSTKGFAVTIYGNGRFYRTSVNPSIEAPSAKQVFEAQSMGLVQGLLNELSMIDYNLWDLNEAHWFNGRGKMARVELDKGAYADTLPKLDHVFRQLVSNEQAAVRSMQQLLRDTAFYAGNIDGRYGAATRTAIREAQKYYGLLETGQADRILIERLAEHYAAGEPMVALREAQSVDPNARVQAEADVLYRCDGVAELSINRFWLASKLTPSRAQTITPISTATPRPPATPTPTQSPVAQFITPANASNRLLIFDGEMTNLHTATIFLPLDIQAEAVVNGQYTFPLAVRAETSAGTAFGTQLLPLGSARIILYTEIPPEINGGDISGMSIKITSTDATMELVIDI